MPIDAIQIRFATSGIPEVSAAFAQVAKQARRFEDQMTEAGVSGSRRRVGAADKEARDKERAAQKVAREAEKAEQKRTKDQEREVKKRIRDESKEQEKARRADIRETEKAEEYKARLRIRSSEMAGRAAAREVREEMREREKAARAAGRLGSSAAGGVGRGLTGMRGQLAGAGLGIAGGFMLADAVRNEVSNEKLAAQIINATTPAGEKQSRSLSQVMATASGASLATGMGRDEILGGMLRYAKSARGGDIAGIEKNIGFFAKLAQTTGTDITDLTDAAGVLQSQNPDLGSEGMRKIMLRGWAQSKAGTMSMADFAKNIGVMTSTRTSFAGDMAENQATLMGLGQIARTGGDVGEAGTFVKDIALEATKANVKFKKHSGKDLFKTDKYGRIESPESLIGDIFRNTKGNIQQINELMGVRGGALFRELEGSYISGAGKKNDVNAGVAAVMANVRSITGASATEADLNKQSAVSLDTPGQKLTVAWNAIADRLQTAVVPAIEAFAKKLGDPAMQRHIDAIIDALGHLAEFVVEHPIGAIIAAKASESIVQAGIGAVVSRAIAGQMTSIPGGPIAAAIAAAIGLAAIAKGAIDDDVAGQADKSRKDTAGSIDAANVLSKVRGHMRGKKVTSQDLQALNEATEQAKARQADLAGGPHFSVGEKLASAFTPEISSIKAGTNLQQQKDVAKDLDQLQTAVQQVTEALKGMAGTVPAAVPKVTPGSPNQPIGHSTRANL
jgi:hypothetical protein